MKVIARVEEAIHPGLLAPGKTVYASGNAATPTTLLRRLAADKEIRGISLYGLLLLGDIGPLFERTFPGSATPAQLIATLRAPKAATIFSTAVWLASPLVTSA